MADNEHPGNAENSSPAGVDFAELTDSELCDEIHRLSRREHEISFQRRFLHGQLQLARTDLARRLTLDRPLSLTKAEIDDLDRLLAGIDHLDGA